MEDGTEEYREVKYAKDVELARLDPTSAVHRKLRAQAAWCEQQRVPYHIITDEDIRKDRIRLVNWKRLLPYLTPLMQHDTAPVQEAVLVLVAKQPMAWTALLDVLRTRFEPERVRAALAALLHQGRLDAPMGQVVIGPSLVVEQGVRRRATR